MFSKLEIANLLKEVLGKLNNLTDNFIPWATERLDVIPQLVKEFVEFKTKLATMETKLATMETQLNQVYEQVDYLYNEVARFTHTDGTVLQSMFAFTRQHEIWCTQQDMAFNSKRASRWCLKNGVEFERIEDPRYGYVMVFPQDTLVSLFVDDEAKDYIGWKRAPKQANTFDTP